MPSKRGRRVCGLSRRGVSARARALTPHEGYRTVILRAFLNRQLARSWARPALICLALFVVLFALAGQTVNAPFVYAPPR